MILFIWIGLVYLIMVALVNLLCRSYKCSKKFFGWRKTWEFSLDFLEGSFFQSMVCTSVSMQSLYLVAYLSTSDKFSIANHMTVFFVLVLFLSLIVYFTIFRMPKLVALSILKQRRKQHKYIEGARKKFK